MQESWRWFGPHDPVSLRDVRQTGALSIVSALHHIPPGVVWSRAEISKRQQMIARDNAGPTGLHWTVIESLPVSEDIKRQTGPWRAHVEAWIASLHNIAASGIQTICYNFMPVLDWTRTDLAWRLPSGASCMRFDLIDFVAFDLHFLQRGGASYDSATEEAARDRVAAMTDDQQQALMRNIVSGLPGAATEMTLQDVRDHLAAYDNISADRLRQNLIDFLELVVGTAEDLGLRLCCHPDDPPFSLLGLPRILSTEADYAAVMRAIDSLANGITLCSGSMGVRADTDLSGMMRRWGNRVHFVHLRNIRRDSTTLPCGFHESGHIDGDVDMIALIREILDEEKRRCAAGRADHSIPFRPDHGLHMSDDEARGGQPGYPLVGRHVGLAELRGITKTLEATGR